MGRIKNSITTKIFLGIAAILLAVSLAMFGILRIFMPNTYKSELTAQLSDNIRDLAEQMQTAPEEKWDDIIISYDMESNAEIGIYDENLKQIAGSNVYVVTDNDYVFSGTNNSSFVTTATAVAFEQEGTPYTIVAQLDRGSVDQVKGIFTKIFPYVFALIVVISALAAFFYSQFLAKPIVEISNVSKRMTSLDMAWKCDVSRSDEIGVLAGNLNEMASRLSMALNELQTANIKLQEDIKKEREQEQRRKDFFSAISHELKTPVTILKGELDGMILGVGKFIDRDRYLQQAYETTESIEKLVREILTLSKLDTLSLDLEDISLASITEVCCRMYEDQARDRQIQIKSNCVGDVNIRADQKQMHTVISNIISNAVKHSPENSAIIISGSEENGAAVLSVENTGAHIDTSELPRLWEPFYRADKSRSRDTGGSGLGLYIVKTILDNHGFGCRFENTDAGMKFTIKVHATSP